MSIVTTTERLHIRQFTTADAAFILDLVNTSSWLEFIGDRTVHTLADAENFLLNGPLKSYRENGFGAYCLQEIDSGKCIGSCGFYKREGLDHPDLGFALLPEFEGKGFGYESSRKLLQIGSNEWAFERILAITTTNNNRSIALLKRLGFVWEKNIILPKNHQELHLFGIDLARV